MVLGNTGKKKAFLPKEKWNLMFENDDNSTLSIDIIFGIV